MAYSTLARVESELKSLGSNETAASVIDGKAYIVTEALEWVTKRIDQMTQQEYAPRREFRYFDATADMSLDPYLNSLILDKPLVDVATVQVADTTLTRWTPDLPYSDRVNYGYFLYPVRQTPYYKLQATKTFWPLFDPGLFSPIAWYPQAYQQAIAVDGLWCYRENYDTEAWLSSGQTVRNNPLTISGTSLQLTSAADFSPGQWLRFADALLPVDDEIALITAVDNASMTKTATILRGQRGTTATAHEQGAAVDFWQTEPNIERACTRWAAYLYQRRAVYETLKVTMGASGSITSVFPQDCPEEMRGILGVYVNLHLARA